MLKLTIGDYTGEIPVTDEDLTLGDRVGFEAAYGSKIRDDIKAFEEVKELHKGDLDCEDVQMSLLDMRISLAIYSISYFAKIPEDILRDTDFEQLLAVYEPIEEMIDRLAARKHIENEYVFEGDRWQIAPPFLDFNSRMTVNEFVTAKMIIKQYNEMDRGKMEALLPLCCIYFRKVGEKFTDDLVIEGGDRWEQMKRLPLIYAMDVSFFLTNSAIALQNYLASSKKPALPAQPKKKKPLKTTPIDGNG